MSVDTINDKGFQIHPRRSSRYPAVYLTDADFADNIVLINHCLEHAQALLHALESVANYVGLYLNKAKTEYVNFSENNSITEIKTRNNTTLKQVDDYKYLGSYISSSEKDFNVRKGMSWAASNDMHKIWISDLPVQLKIQIF